MKTTLQLLTAIAICLSVQSCASDDATGEKDGDNSDATNSEMTNSTENENASESEDTSTESAAKASSGDYHITLDKDGEELTSGMGPGKVMISDAFICTVNEWKMRIQTEVFDPKAMVGNIYEADVISKEYTSMDCTCQMMNVTGTGEKNTIGEKVKMEGEVTCDEGAVAGTFVVQLVQPGK